MIKEFWKRFWTDDMKKKLRSEAADSVTMFVITSMFFIFLVTGWAIDTAKNASVRADLNDIAQESVQSAVRVQDGNGNLKGSICQKGGSTGWLHGSRDIELWAAEHWTTDPAITLVLHAYQEKTGRGANALYSRPGQYNEAFNARQGDYQFVRNMRSVGFSDIDRTGDNNPFDRGSDEDLKYYVRVTCSSGLYFQGKNNRGDKDYSSGITSGNKVSTGKDKINTITIEVQDWTSNFLLGFANGLIPNVSEGKENIYDGGTEWKNVRKNERTYNFSYQTFRIQQSAVTSWSSSAVK